MSEFVLSEVHICADSGSKHIWPEQIALPMHEPNGTEEEPVDERELLEQWKPLSQSVLWKLQRQFYEQAGPSAWSLGNSRMPRVPSYITSNAFLASSYVRTVIEFFRSLPAASRCFVLELGSGSGQFAFLFVRKWLRLCSEQGIDPTSLCFVLTDFTAENVEAYTAHPQFHELARQGLVDFAVVDALQQ
jgi:hypothetical protein